MRRVVTIWAWIGFLAVTPAATQARAQAQPGLKIAFISSQQILEQTPGYAAAESTFKKEYQGFQDEAQKLKQQFDSPSRCSKNSPSPPPPTRSRPSRRRYSHHSSGSNSAPSSFKIR